MTQLIILSKPEKKAFMSAPILNKKERLLYFRLDQQTRLMVGGLRKPENKIGILLQLGYFRASGKFYAAKQFRKRDINTVCQLLGIKDFKGFDRAGYANTSMLNHQERIRGTLQWQRCDEKEGALLSHRAQWLAANQRKPKDVFWSLVDYCWKSQIEIPAFTRLSEIVSQCYINFESYTLEQLRENLTAEHLEKLEIVDSANYQNDNDPTENLRALKKISQSLSVGDIRLAVRTANVFKKDYFSFEDVYDALKLSDQATEYFSTWVQKSTTHQFSQIPNDNKRYLYLLAFIRHQFFSRQDALVDTFMKCVASSANKVREKIKENENSLRESRQKAIKVLSETSKNSRQLLDEIKTIVKGYNATANEKFYKIKQLIEESDNNDDSPTEKNITDLEKTLLSEANNEAYYAAIKDHSLALQNRVSGIISELEFNKKSSSKSVLNAIEFYRINEGKLTQDAPTEFLTATELAAITSDDGINIYQYKYLLFLHISSAIKSGKLNLKYSYRYRAVEDYLIDSETWERDKNILLKAAGLDKYRSAVLYLEKQKKQLEKKYETINANYKAGKNPYLSALENGHVSIKTPNINHSRQEYIATTLSKEGIVPVQQVLAEIDSLCQFSKEFDHLSVKHHKRNVKLETIIAGVIAKGCNIGLGKMSKISEGVNASTLRNTVNWYFSVKNLQAANKSIVAMINNLPLARNYLNNSTHVHSSSDGRKVNVAVDSLHSKRSYKYFGKNKGVDIYTFTDETQSLFHNTVISSTDRDAPYVIDGLVQNDVKEERIHSTDEHGFSEAVHAATHFIDVSFAPRFKKLKNKALYGFSTKSHYRKKGYDIYPSSRIKQNIIIDQWDNILRFIASIKLGFSTASQLFQRLSSYAKDHPLYKALKEFGRICKTQYILTYCEDLKLRQQVQKMLNRIELSNKFSKAIFFDNSGEFHEGTKEEQEIATACKVLIQNAIILWNYLSLSEIIINTKGKEERAEIIESIMQGSVLSWRSINFYGQYSFKNIAANEPRFDLEGIKAMNIG